MNADDVVYHLLNAVGGICLIINSIALHDTPNFFVNLVWVAIAAYSLHRILIISRNKRANR